VSELQDLASLVLDLQRERSSTALNTYVAVKTGDFIDLSEIYATTDRTLNSISWKEFSKEKIFESKLRFQIKLDDFR